MEAQIKALEARSAELQALSDQQQANLQQSGDMSANLERMYATLDKQATSEKSTLQVPLGNGVTANGRFVHARQ